MSPDPLLSQVDSLCASVEVLSGGNAGVLEVRRRLHEPLRIAIAGRVKAGKSTLLNSLVGERLAATDASECTRIVTWYRFGPGYGVRAVIADGTERPVAFHRDEALSIEAEDLEGVCRLEVSWPASRLERMTLIDTPGLASALRETTTGAGRMPTRSSI